MGSALGWLAGLGGVVVFIGAAWAFLRGLFKQINAVDANTRALNQLTKKVDEHSERISNLEGYVRSNRPNRKGRMI